MNRRQKIIVSVTGIFLVLLILVGLTYAFFVTRIRGNNNPTSISVTTANLRLVYEDDTNQVIGGEKLEPSNTVYTKTFTVTNEGNANINYGVYLIDVINTFERKDDIKYTLECSTTGSIECDGKESTTFPSGISELITNEIEPNKTHTYTFSFTYKDTGTDQSVDMGKELSAKIQIFGENGKGVIIPFETNTLAFNIINNASAELNGTVLDLEQAILPKVANESSEYTYGKNNPITYPLELKNPTAYYIAYACDYTVSEDETGNYFGPIITLGTEECPVTIMTEKYVYSEELAKELAGKYVFWSRSSITSTNDIKGDYALYKITTDTNKITENTINYIRTNLYVSTEKVLSTDYDDYGTSYYYRGGVKDNYINFADMCWRIVRIEGDGSVKLILEDQDQLCNAKNNKGNLIMNGNFDIPTTTGSAVTKGNFGYSNSKTDDFGNNLITLNYLNLDGTAENHDKSMASAFKNFQSTFTNDEIKKLKKGNWCLADNAYSLDTEDIKSAIPLTEEQKTEEYSRNLGYFYDSGLRLDASDSKQPSLKCNGTSMDLWGDNITPMYVGTLTADEIMYAGAGPAYLPSYSYYLLNDYSNSTQIIWLSLSPISFSGADSVFAVYNEYGGSFLDKYPVNFDLSFRPSISLVSDIAISDGDGTIDNPYEIK